MTPQRDEAGRPRLDPLLADFTRELCRARPDAFGHLVPERILFVAGAARRAARASIRGFADPKPGAARTPQVFVNRERIRYEVCLRPRFFLDARPEARARVLAHELWHISQACDGHLHPDRRHGARPEAALEAELDALLEGFDPKRTALWPTLEGPGERRLRAWRVRPPGALRTAGERLRYDEADLFSAVVLQV